MTDIAFEAREDAGHWMTYWHQIREVLAVRPRRVLAVGTTEGVLESYLEHAGVTVETAASLDNLPASTFDVVCAFDAQLDDLDVALTRLAAATTEHVFLTLRYDIARMRWRFWWGDHIIGFGRERVRNRALRDRVTDAMAARFEIVSHGFVKDDPRHYLWHLRRRGG